MYEFQTHMELTHKIIEAGLEDAGESLKTGGRFVQPAEDLLAFDYTEMNTLLSSFLNAMIKEAAALSGIGEQSIRQQAVLPDAHFAFKVGKKQ